MVRSGPGTWEFAGGKRSGSDGAARIRNGRRALYMWCPGRPRSSSGSPGRVSDGTPPSIPTDRPARPRPRRPGPGLGSRRSGWWRTSSTAGAADARIRRGTTHRHPGGSPAPPVVNQAELDPREAADRVSRALQRASEDAAGAVVQVRSRGARPTRVPGGFRRRGSRGWSGRDEPPRGRERRDLRGRLHRRQAARATCSGPTRASISRCSGSWVRRSSPHGTPHRTAPRPASSSSPSATPFPSVTRSRSESGGPRDTYHRSLRELRQPTPHRVIAV